MTPLMGVGMSPSIASILVDFLMTEKLLFGCNMDAISFDDRVDVIMSQLPPKWLCNNENFPELASFSGSNVEIRSRMLYVRGS